MRRSLSRAVVTLWTLWFALITVGPGGFGACPEHGTGHDHGAATPVVASAVDPHAGHQGMSHGAAATNAEHHTPPAHHQCTCLGACCMMAPSALPAATELLAAGFVARPVTPTTAYRTIVAARRVLAHPYAIGPPVASIA